MTECWREGELRAYLDGELPAHDIERAAAHIQECAACGGLYADLAERAARIAGLFDASVGQAFGLPPGFSPAPRRRSGKAASFSAALAASLVIAVLLLSKHPPRQTAVEAVPPPAAAPPAAPVPPPPQVKPAIVRRRVPPKPVPRVVDYVALDDEPIETGVVVRVAIDAGLSGGQVPADVIFGPDGRARAIRLVTDISGERP